MTRIAPLEPPYAPDVAARLESLMPPGVPPIGLFRTLARNLPMTAAMSGWGRYELGPGLSLSMREREIVIVRTCARCRCEYEWGVHLQFFAGRVGLTGDQIRSLTAGSAGDPCWTVAGERALIRVVDALCDTGDVDDERWAAAREVLTEPQLLDLLMLCGWYHAISFTARAVRVAPEPGAPRFADVAVP
ncbi:carboxymuconolactone decarboxylase family protein [Actinoplanes sp. NPDC004185]